MKDVQVSCRRTGVLIPAVAAVRFGDAVADAGLDAEACGENGCEGCEQGCSVHDN